MRRLLALSVAFLLFRTWAWASPPPLFQTYPTVSSGLSYIYLTTTGGGTSFSVPGNWNANQNGPGGFANKIECIGAGGSGYSGLSPGGGAGGDYAVVTNVFLLAYGTANYNIDAGGSASSGSWVKNSSTVFASDGGNGGHNSAGSHSAGGASIGSTTYAGGNGNTGGGAGGAAGPNGAGAAGSGASGGTADNGSGGTGGVGTTGGAGSEWGSYGSGGGGGSTFAGGLYGGGGGGGNPSGGVGQPGMCRISYYPLQ